MTDASEEHAIAVFAEFENLLLQPPVSGRVVLQLTQDLKVVVQPLILQSLVIFCTLLQS